ncbi:MAG: response regulator [Myxococcales bacterium]|nr:response regulator [Myxococcales bacterium]
MDKLLNDHTVLSSHQVCRILQASPSAVINWIDQGMLNGFRTPGGHRRVKVADLRDFLKNHNMPVPPVLRGKPSRRPRVFIIDDEQKVINAIKRGMKMSRAEVDVDGATDGVEALVSIGMNPPDLILLDIYMDGLDGFEVCKRLRKIEQLQEVRIVAVSGSPSENDRRKILKYGAEEYWEKPVDVGRITHFLGVDSEYDAHP